MRTTFAVIGLMLVIFGRFVFAIEKKDFLQTHWMDLTTPYQTNFYQYANGTWLKNNPVPEDHASWSVFHELQETNLKKIRQLLVDASTNPDLKPGSINKKVGDFYYSGMDETQINQLGVRPLNNEFLRIQAIRTQHDLHSEIARLHSINVDVLFGFGSMIDFTNSKKHIAAVMQGGLGLPDREYYLKSDPSFKTIRQAYQRHIKNMFLLLGDNSSQATTNATSVMSIETELARISLSPIEQRDPHAIYHPVSIKTLQKLTPQFSWKRYFDDMNHPEIKQVNLGMPHFIGGIQSILNHHSLEEWKAYLRWHLIDTYAPYLSNDFVNEDFKMTQALTGAKKLMPRWKRVVETENWALGFAVGELYVERYFSKSAKEDVNSMIQHIKKVLRHDLKNLEWMSQNTKQHALEKLDNMTDRVGYPEKWWDYSSLIINRKYYVLNVLRANQFLVKRDLNKIGKPIDQEEWEMTPQTINAYYNPTRNQINLPAGILQPPFYDANAPAAVNYGAIGFVIGHEITHGFDDQGAKFDAHGNLNNWWTKQDLQRFKAATACIAKQFSKYKINQDSVQGELVVGEATADLGGLTLAYRAFLNSRANSQQTKNLQGFTPTQQFFLSMAHIWANNTRKEQSHHLLNTDPHPPAVWRVNGTLANMPEFQAAFTIPNSSPMVHPERCIVW